MKNVFKQLICMMTLVFSLILPLTARALPVDGLLGRWVTLDTIQQPGVQFQIGFEFAPARTFMTVKCFYPDGGFLVAQASSSTDYLTNDIYLQETNQSITQDGRHFCRATLQPDKRTALFDGTGRIILFMDRPYRTRLTLVREDI